MATTSSPTVEIKRFYGDGPAVSDWLTVNQALIDLDGAFGEPGDETPASDTFVEGQVRNWSSDPYVLGSYSYPAPGTRPGYPTPTETMRQKLAKPVGSTLFFAGEETNNSNAADGVGLLVES